MTTHIRTSARVRLFAAIVGGSAVLSLGALTAAWHEEATAGGGSPTYLSNKGEMTLGNEATTTMDEPTEIATAKAVPAVKAKPYGEG